MEVAEPDPLPVSDVRNWAEMMHDALSAVFAKLGAIEILMGAGLVCRSWLNAAKQPDLWRTVDMTRHRLIFRKDSDVMCSMAKVAIDHFARRLESFWAQKFADTDLLKYIADRTKSLKSLRLIACICTGTAGILKVAENSSSVEELENSHNKLWPPGESYEYIGRVCPQLKCLRVNTPWFDSDSAYLDEKSNDSDEDEEMVSDYDSDEYSEKLNAEAFAITKNMQGLLVLQIIGNQLTNKGLDAILESRPPAP